MNVVFDLDGTLADCRHRNYLVHGVEKPDWYAYYQLCGLDTPIWPVVELATNLIRRGNRIEIWTGRSAIVRADTEDWLNGCGLGALRGAKLLMRPEGDYRPDTELKARWLATARESGFVPDLIIEDRTRMIDFWRSQGIVALQCAEGDF